jgi:hypothetical protein
VNIYQAVITRKGLFLQFINPRRSNTTIMRREKLEMLEQRSKAMSVFAVITTGPKSRHYEGWKWWTDWLLDYVRPNPELNNTHIYIRMRWEKFMNDEYIIPKQGHLIFDTVTVKNQVKLWNFSVYNIWQLFFNTSSLKVIISNIQISYIINSIRYNRIRKSYRNHLKEYLHIL